MAHADYLTQDLNAKMSRNTIEWKDKISLMNAFLNGNRAKTQESNNVYKC
jgi:hypothetical protein